MDGEDGSNVASEIVDGKDTVQYKKDKNIASALNLAVKHNFLNWVIFNAVSSLESIIISLNIMRDFALGNFSMNIAGDAENWMRMQEATEVLINDLKLIRPGM